MILDKIVCYKKRELLIQKQKMPLAHLLKIARQLPPKKHGFMKALNRKKGINLICELKKASPSHGLIRKNFSSVSLAKDFEKAGACAISILTEERFFKGSPKILKQVRRNTKLPILRKDFIIDPYQVCETFVLGADAFLLIASLLDDRNLEMLISLGEWFGMDPLIEVRSKHELRRALKDGAKIIGINNRDLKTLRINPSYAKQLLSSVPKTIIPVIESGIESHKQICEYLNLRVNSFLVGTSLMKSRNVKSTILEMLGKTKKGKPNNAKN